MPDQCVEEKSHHSLRKLLFLHYVQEMQQAETRFQDELSALKRNLTRQFRKDMADACDATIIEQQVAAHERLAEEVEPLEVCMPYR